MVSTQEAYRKIGWRDESLFSCLPSIGKPLQQAHYPVPILPSRAISSYPNKQEEKSSLTPTKRALHRGNISLSPIRTAPLNLRIYRIQHRKKCLRSRRLTKPIAVAVHRL